MEDVYTFGALVTLVAVALSLAVLSSRLSDAIRVPAPAVFLVAAAVASDLVPALDVFSVQHVQRVVTVALIYILFDGGMHVGWRRFRAAAGPIITVGIVGTFLTAGAVALLAHGLFGLGWRRPCCWGRPWPPPTRRWSSRCSASGRWPAASGAIIEGESGVNDPVGIALMASLLIAPAAVGIGTAPASSRCR